MCHLHLHRKFPKKLIGYVILDSDIAGSSEDTQRIQPKPNYQVRRPVCGHE